MSKRKKAIDISLLEKAALILSWVAGVVAFGQILRLVIAATAFPMELEVREGYSWLLVLAMKAGHNIYDHSSVAMLSSHYGPIEPVVKYLLAVIFPDMPSQVNTRIFVPVLPVALFIMAFQIFGGWGRFRIPLALMAASIGFMSFINILPFNGLVGRTDILASVLVALQAGSIVYLNRKDNLHAGHLIWPASLPTLIFLTNTRSGPVCGTLWLVQAASLLARDRVLTLKFVLMSIFGLAAFISACVFLQMGGDFELFYKHFFGVQLYSGLNSPVASSQVSIFPEELLYQWYRAVPIFGVFLASAVGLLLIPKQKLGRGLGWAALGLAAIAYVVLDLAYQFNIRGAGVHYFDPLLIQLWWLLLVLLSDWPGRAKNVAVSLLLLIYLGTVPSWRQVSWHLNEFSTYHEEAQKFRNTLSELYDRGELMSEALQFYKSQMGKSLVDAADTITGVIPTKYFGEEFNQTVSRFWSQIEGGEFKYFLHDGIVSPTSTKALHNLGYKAIAQGPAYATWNGPGGCLSPINCNLLLMKP